MLALWNHSGDKVKLFLTTSFQKFKLFQVIISTYKVATVLEVDINQTVRNKRKEKALEAISNLINSSDDQKSEHSKGAHDVKEEKKHGNQVKDNNKSDKKKKKKSKHK